MYFCVYMYFKPSNYIIKKETEVTHAHRMPGSPLQ